MNTTAVVRISIIHNQRRGLAILKNIITAALSVLIILTVSTCVFADSADRMVISNGDYNLILHGDTPVKLVSNQAHATVLNIPESIEGYEITEFTGVELSSPCVTKIVFGKNIERVSSLAVWSADKSEVPVCSLLFNEGLKNISADSDITNREDGLYYPNRIPKLIKLLILPESLEKIEKNGLYTTNYENIVIQSRIDANDYSVTRCCHDEENYTLFKPITSTDVYLSQNSSISVSAFNTISYFDTVNPEDNPHINTNNYLKFNLTDSDSESGKYEEAGYTVREYTGEWWKNIKEIQSVELTGKGLAEKKSPEAKGTVTNLGWSASNDPAQYLSREYELKMKPGESITLQTSFSPADAFDNRLFFVSLNEDIAAIDIESGEIKALKSGEATIRCVAASGVYSDCVITVSDTGGSSIIEKIKNNPVVAAVCSGAAAVAAFFVWLISHIAGWFKK